MTEPLPISALAEARAAAARGDLAAARRHYATVLAVDPHCLEAIANAGLLSLHLGDRAAAIPHLAAAAARLPDDARIQAALGSALLAEDRPADALPALIRAAELKDDAESWVAVGTARLAGWAFDDAAACFIQALARAPGQASALGGLSACHAARGDLDAAIGVLAGVESYRFVRAHLLLKQGRYRDGWAVIATMPKARDGLARWAGEPLAGRSILLTGEGGMGDIIQLMRFAPVLAASGARVTVQVPADLVRLARSLDGVAAVIADGEPPPGPPVGPTEVWAPWTDLPGRLGVALDTLPAAPYLRAQPALAERWAAILAGVPRPRVGLVWGTSGGRKPPLETAWARHRQMDPARLAPLLEVPAGFVSLQKEVPPEAVPPGMAAVMHHAHDFADNAALLAQLDLVITVDTAMAHLGGALGRPTWVMLMANADWRWLTDRTDSPWYPTVRLFRQVRLDDWAGVIDQVRRALIQRLR